jgi:5-(carboxyamino)imidazole ribonucleotide synthase
MKRLGIVGGGQLGRMMAMEAGDLDVSITVLDPNAECPSSEFAEVTVGDFTDKQTVLDFGKDKDVLTFEIESANVEALFELQAAGKEIHPSPQTLSVVKDKFLQKEFLTEHGILVAPYAEVVDSASVEKFAEAHGYPLVLKSRCGAYDGRGNRTVASVSDIAPAMEELGEGLYVEAWVLFKKELAVVAARDKEGSIQTYPVVETTHVDHICATVIAPADVPPDIAEKAKALANKILEVFHGAGVFGIEMFLTEDDGVLVNEIAPRVHNSGHFTLGGSTVSQFKQHMRAVLGLSLLEPEMSAPFAVMKNIIGAQNAPAEPQGVLEAQALGAHVEIYGKKDTKVKRKMGHLTVTGETESVALTLAEKAHASISI